LQVDIAVPEVFVGGLLGATVVFLFASWSMVAVGRTAQVGGHLVAVNRGLSGCLEIATWQWEEAVRLR